MMWYFSGNETNPEEKVWWVLYVYVSLFGNRGVIIAIIVAGVCEDKVGVQAVCRSDASQRALLYTDRMWRNNDTISAWHSASS
jgi:hypothetical protein